MRALKTKKPSLKEGFVNSQNALRPRSTPPFIGFLIRVGVAKMLENVDSNCRHPTNVP